MWQNRGHCLPRSAPCFSSQTRAGDSETPSDHPLNSHLNFWKIHYCGLDSPNAFDSSLRPVLLGEKSPSLGDLQPGRSESRSGCSPVPHWFCSFTLTGAICVAEGRAGEGWLPMEIEAPVSSRKQWCWKAIAGVKNFLRWAVQLLAINSILIKEDAQSMT